ncbi:MAG: hypothetical protein ABSA90_07420 [Xanthobacteraceae bacterium]
MSTSVTTAAAREWTAPTTANWLVAVVILALFVLACIASAARKDVTTGFDEPAHVSYVAHIQHTGDAWPVLEKMRLMDTQTFQFTEEPNFLNHPPIFYALLAALGPKLEGHPQALLAYRLFDVAFVAIGLAALLGLALTAQFSRPEFYAYAIPLACIPILVQLAAAVNNDNLAFVGGALATLGVWQLVATDRGIWLACALIGMVAASWAKLTGLLLTAAMVSAMLAYLLWRGRMRWTWMMAAGFAFVLAAAPYVIYVLQYGTPTPETPAQLALLEDGARAAGWADLPRKSFPSYLATFIAEFIAGWMPTLHARSAFNYAMLAVPVAALICASAGAALSLRRLCRRRETPLDVVVLTGALALVATFAIHVGYSYSRHLAIGWLLDAYPRYYLPLAAIVPLAGLSLIAEVEAPRWRTGLLAFLIAGPVIFRIFGAPLG